VSEVGPVSKDSSNSHSKIRSGILWCSPMTCTISFCSQKEPCQPYLVFLHLHDSPLVFYTTTMNVTSEFSTGSFQGTNTAESSDLPARQDSPRTSRRPPTLYHPLVRSMVSSNTMKDCHQVKDMHSQCMVSNASDESYVCRTAKRYHAACEEFEK
jgi:hypothetical protein